VPSKFHELTLVVGFGVVTSELYRNILCVEVIPHGFFFVDLQI
jgi:hypothetical protein